jgi:predicted TIM-barrel fold metal-dependent hydrolase
MSAFKTISADSHVAEPGDLWTRYIDPAFRERGPRLVSEPHSDVWYCEGLPPSPAGLITPANTPSERLKREGRYADGIAGGWDPDARLKDMALDGVDAEVLYPTVGMRFYKLTDVALLNAILRAYNRWLADFCARHPDRLKGVGLVALDDADAAVAELPVIKELGLAGVGIGVYMDSEHPYSHERFEPFWAKAEELGLPVSLHIQTGKQGATDFLMVDYATIPYWNQRSLAAMVFGGVFERHPDLVAISVESDIGWVANFLARMDHTFRRHRFLWGMGGLKSDKMLPSEYYRRNVRATFMKDAAGVATRHLIGVETLMWASDYPHADSTWPHSREAIAEQFAGVPEDERRLILRDNVAGLYAF